MERSRPRILVAVRPDGIRPPGLLEAAGSVADFSFARTAAEVVEQDLSAEAVFVWNFRSPLVPELLDRMPYLRWVHVAAVGVDASLSPAVVESPVVVTNSRGVTAQAMAEYALALMLLDAKDLRQTLTDQATRVWRPRLSRSLAGACLVTIGVGAVNQTLARIAAGLGMRVIGVARSGRQARPPFARIVSHERLLEILPEADYVVVATPQTAETVGLIGKAQLDAMRPTALLVNIGRGQVIEEQSLLEALSSGSIRGAALDVVSREPLDPSHPFWAMPNVLISPHMSSDAVGWQEAMVDVFVENLRRWCAGEPLLNVVDKGLGYVTGDNRQ